MDALFSIKPCYVQRIFDETKKYEFRKKCCKEKVEKIYIYATAPVGAILGECKVKAILKDSPSLLWKIVSRDAGIPRSAYFRYFKGKKMAVAYKLDDVVQYKKPISLSAFNLKTPPQSFCYIR